MREILSQQKEIDGGVRSKKGIFSDRRKFLKRTAVSAFSVAPVATSSVGRAQTFTQSFEGIQVGGQELPDPWFLFGSGGTHEVTDETSTHGNKSFRTADAPLGNPSAIAVSFDFDYLGSVLFDVHAISNTPSHGNIKFSIDEAGYPNPNRKNLWDFAVTVSNRFGVPSGGGENSWIRDFEVDLSNVEGKHTAIFWVDGDNGALWDNIRFVSAERDSR